MRKPLVSFLFVALALIGTSGCIFSPKDEDQDPPPPQPIPGNDTPENTMRRFMATYEQKKGIEYEGLFTNDFTFEFSNTADPALAAQYASGWFKEDERISAQNLFQGFTDGTGAFVPAASSIDINLAPVAPQPDPTAPGGDFVRYYQLLAEVDAAIVVPPRVGQTEETTYLVDNNVHRFFLIRGDAAAGNLDPEQAADSLHWYIYRWRDETATVGAQLRLASVTPRQTATTLGRVKASTR